MRPVDHDEVNCKLTAPGLPAIPAEQLELREPDGSRHRGYETRWMPDEGERRALGNGAPVVVQIRGAIHPPIGVTVGEPDMAEARPLLNEGHVHRALGALYGELKGALSPEEEAAPAAIDAEAFLTLWERCLKRTATPPGDGFSVDDLIDAEDQDDG